MERIITQFLQGASCAWKGMADYAARPALWKYAAIPTSLVTVLYCALAYVLCTMTWPAMKQAIHDSLTATWIAWAADFLACLAGLLAAVTVILVLALMLSTIVEAVGGPFFAAMVRHYEADKYRRKPAPELSLLRDCRNTLACVIYALNTCILAGLFYLLSFPFPLVAHLAAILILGYRYGLGYSSEAGFNRNWTLAQIARHFPHRKAYLYGFGTAVFFILLIPFLSILAIPALFLGGTILINEFASDVKNPRNDT